MKIKTWKVSNKILKHQNNTITAVIKHTTINTVTKLSRALIAAIIVSETYQNIKTTIRNIMIGMINNLIIMIVNWKTIILEETTMEIGILEFQTIIVETSKAKELFMCNKIIDQVRIKTMPILIINRKLKKMKTKMTITSLKYKMKQDQWTNIRMEIESLKNQKLTKTRALVQLTN